MRRNILESMYKTLEDKFHPKYPSKSNATYSSLLNFSDDLNTPFQRWYRYKEGFSTKLVDKILDEYQISKDSQVLDPFLGGGSTILSATDKGMKGKGFEVNPFSLFLSKTKLRNYSSINVNNFNKAFNHIMQESLDSKIDYQLPKLSFAERVFPPKIESYYLRIKALIEKEYADQEYIYDLLKLGWLSQLEYISNYRKAGNGLKIRRYKNPRNISVNDVYQILFEQYMNMYLDMLNFEKTREFTLYPKSSLSMEEQIESNSISAIIFSPPYANCFDYTEIYKLELWFGDFVKSYDDMRSLRNISLRSHLSADLRKNNENEFIHPILEDIFFRLKGIDLWDDRIPYMVNDYFYDMNSILHQSYNLLKHNGLCSIVVGNSSYGGVIIPTDLLFSELAIENGFTVDSFEIDRFLITSSQQYDETKENGNYLRESVICLKK